MSCDRYDDLARYEAGALLVSDADALDRHVSTCAECNAERSVLRKTLADLKSGNGAAEPFVARVLTSIRAESISPRAGHRAFALRPWLLAAACLALVAGLTQHAPKMRGTFQARGGSAETLPPAHAGVILFRGGRLQPIPRAGLTTHDAFAVTITNKTSDTHYLLAFGVDARGEVHWLYPEYRVGAPSPAAVAVPPGTPDNHMLEQFVAPEAVASGPFRVVTVMAKQTMDVRDIEARLARQKHDEPVSSLFPSASVREWRSHWSTTP